MSAKIPQKIAESELTSRLKRAGLERYKDPGKVSELWELPEQADKLMLFTTDRMSIFDLVLNCQVGRKGEVITAMTVLIFKKVLKNFNTHLVGWGCNIDQYLPEELKGNSELQKRALIIQKLEIEPIECIVREHITGSAWQEYQKTGMVWGKRMPEDLFDGAKLLLPIFTPTTKADDGHDMSLDSEAMENDFGPDYEYFARWIFNILYGYCWDRDIVLADAKLEFSKNKVLVDKFSPDEARLWDKDEWFKESIQRKAPQGYDKQPVRDWGKTIITPFTDEEGMIIVGINNLDPANEKHIQFVQSVTVPEQIIKQTTERYLEIFRRLNNGKSLEEFQQKVMCIK